MTNNTQVILMVLIDINEHLKSMIESLEIIAERLGDLDDELEQNND